MGFEKTAASALGVVVYASVCGHFVRVLWTRVQRVGVYLSGILEIRIVKNDKLW